MQSLQGISLNRVVLKEGRLFVYYHGTVPQLRRERKALSPFSNENEHIFIYLIIFSTNIWGRVFVLDSEDSRSYILEFPVRPERLKHRTYYSYPGELAAEQNVIQQRCREPKTSSMAHEIHTPAKRPVRVPRAKCQP